MKRTVYEASGIFEENSIKTEDSGQAKIYEGCLEISRRCKDLGFWVQLKSWFPMGNHYDHSVFNSLIGKKVIITVQVEDDQFNI